MEKRNVDENVRKKISNRPIEVKEVRIPEKRVSYNRSRRPSAYKEKETHVVNWFLIIILLIVIVFIFFLFSDTFVEIKEGGFVQTKLGKIFAPVWNGLKYSSKFFLGQLSKTSKILKGEETFSLEGSYEEWVRSGLELDELRGSGLGFGSVEEELIVSTNILVGRMDENMEYMDAVVSCKMDDVNGVVSSGYGGEEIGDGSLKLEIYNPGNRGDVKVPVDCVFNKEDIELEKAVNLKKVEFELGYNSVVESELDVFVVPERIFREYRGRFDIFDVLERGKYKSYNTNIASKMMYMSDVEARMGFDYQPLGVNGVYYLGFQFINRNFDNKVNIIGFDVELPEGMSFEECKYLEGNSLRSVYFERIDKELSKEGSGESSGFKCKVGVSEDALGGSIGEILKTESIKGKLSYVYSVVKEKSFEIRGGN